MKFSASGGWVKDDDVLVTRKRINGHRYSEKVMKRRDGSTKKIRVAGDDDDDNTNNMAPAMYHLDVDNNDDAQHRVRRNDPATELLVPSYASRADAEAALHRYGASRGLKFHTKHVRESNTETTLYYHCIYNRSTVSPTEMCTAKFVAKMDKDTGIVQFVQQKCIVKHSNHPMDAPIDPEVAIVPEEKEEKKTENIINESFMAFLYYPTVGQDPETRRFEWVDLVTKKQWRQRQQQQQTDGIQAGSKEKEDTGIVFPPGLDVFGKVPYRLSDQGNGERSYYVWKGGDIRVRCRDLGRDNFRDAQPIANAVEFAKCLRPTDQAYFRWWSERVNLNVTVFLRIQGVNAIDVQQSLLYLHKKHGVLNRGVSKNSAFHRHAVFSSANAEGNDVTYLAINVFALRAYRAVTTNMVKVSHSMPKAPLLMQLWTQCPLIKHDAEQSVRRFGMYAVLSFMADILDGGGDTCARKNTSGQHPRIYRVNEKRFEIYDYFPEYLALLLDDDGEIFLDSYMSVNAEVNNYDSYYGRVAAFVFQREEHHICRDMLHELFKLFNGLGVTGRDLQSKYPIAWEVIKRLRDYPEPTATIPMTVRFSSSSSPPFSDTCDKNKGGGVFSANAPPASSTEQSKGTRVSSIAADKDQCVDSGGILVHHYLYELCFDTSGLLNYSLRRKLARRIFINDSRDIFRPTEHNQRELLSAYTVTETMRPRGLAKVRPNRNPLVLSRYELHYSRHPSSPSAPPLLMEPFSCDPSDLWPLSSLYATLKCMDHLRRDRSQQIERKDETLAYPGSEVAAGPLFICDPVNFAMHSLNLPVACGKGSNDVAHINDTLWVRRGVYAPNVDRVALEAYLLVRDPSFYVKTLAGMRKRKQQQQTMTKSANVK